MQNETASPRDLDVALVGAGIMSATLGAMLRVLDPGLRIGAFERLAAVALESSDAMNNAGTGHAANCELNYTPESAAGGVDPAKAIAINEQFETSLQFWSSLVELGALPAPSSFLTPVPHMSFVWGEADRSFLRRRHEVLAAHHFFAGMDYSQDPRRIAEWAPLVMSGRDEGQAVAATRVARGSDVDFGALTRALFAFLERREGFGIDFGSEVRDIRRGADGRWTIIARNRSTGRIVEARSRFVFLGAGGGSFPLLMKSGIPEGRGYGGFPVSGEWLVCGNPEVVARHGAKVYGKAALGAPPMSVPHLDTRVIAGKRGLLFGPYAGFSTKYLKAGSLLDLPRAIKPGNLVPMAAAGLGNLPLTGYLIGQVLQSPADRMRALREYFPEARPEDWSLAIAGQRVQVIKPDPQIRGRLEFGTEVVTAADGSLAALLGASPGASTAAPTMIGLIRRCFPDRAASPEWQAVFKRLVPAFGQSLAKDPALHERIRARNNEILGLKG